MNAAHTTARILAAAVALALAVTARAETAAPASVPFHGKVAAVAGSTLTVGKREFVADDATKITKNGKPATLADAAEGEQVGGSYRDVDGKRILRSLRIGPKPVKTGTKTSAKPAKD